MSRKVTKENCLANTFPEIAAEWHPTKNGTLTPYDVTSKSSRDIWWLMPYDDPKTGKHWEFEWTASPWHRCHRKTGCPQLSGLKVEAGFNDLASGYPEIASEWHPTKNGSLTPNDVTSGSNKKVWWLKPYDDPKTGKHWEFEWPAAICDRCFKKYGCPQLSGNRLEQGFNDLASLYPEIATQWDYSLNKGTTPSQVLPGCRDSYHWVYPYNDPITGKHWDFRWEARVYSRTKNGRGCPQLANQKIEKGFNDLATTNPETAAKWDYKLNGDIKPQDVFAGSRAKFHWVYPYDDPQTGKHWEFRYVSSIADAVRQTTCPQLAGKIVEVGFNDLATTNPDTAKKWDYELNEKTPFEVMAGSHKKYHWVYPYDDPQTGKHWDFKYEASINDAVKYTTCPQLAGKKVEVGFNDLGSLHPEIADQWDYEKNNGITPFDVLEFSNKYYYWRYPYVDPKTGKHWVFKWRAKVSNRVNFPACPFLINRSLWLGFNDFETLYPELAKEWHPTANGKLKPSDVCGAPDLDVWWLYSYKNPLNGVHHDYKWRASIVNRVRGTGCPYLPSYESNGEQTIKEYLDNTNIRYDIQATFPELLGVGGRKLSYDFLVHYDNRLVLIEYQGIQHYEPVDFDGKGEEHAKNQFLRQKEHDHRKRQYAKKHGYKMITIKYTYATYDQISEYLDEHLRVCEGISVNRISCDRIYA